MNTHKEIKANLPLTWEDAADIYHQITGKNIRIYSMNILHGWMVKHKKDLFSVDAEDNFILKKSIIINNKVDNHE